MNNLIKIMLLLMSFNCKVYASSTSRLFLRGYVPPKYSVTVKNINKIIINSNVVNNDSIKMRVEKKGKLLNCHIVQQ